MNSLSLAVRGQAMPSFISRKIQRIFIYLLATIGIIFLVLLITRQIREGFQAATPEPNIIDKYRQDCLDRLKTTGAICPSRTDGPHKIFTCPDETTAMKLLQCDRTFSDTIVQDGPVYLNLTDSICYKSEVTQTYLCYNRPPLLAYDSELNTTVYNNPGIPGMYDPVPTDLDNDIPGICPSYQASYTLLYKGISSISTNLSEVNSNLSVLSNVYNTIPSRR